MNFSDYKVMTFDVVGTLIDFETGVLRSIRRLGGDASKDLKDDEILHQFRDAHTRYRGRFLATMPDVYRYVAKPFGLPDDDQTAREFQREAFDWPAFPDLTAALKRLRKHFRLVAMTNVDRVALSAYAPTPGDPFDDTCTCDDTGTEKPDPAYFAYNRERQSAFSYKFREILHTAQSQYHDIGVAMSLGCPSVTARDSNALSLLSGSKASEIPHTSESLMSHVIICFLRAAPL